MANLARRRGDEPSASYADRASPEGGAFEINEYPFFLINSAAGKYNAALASALARIKVDAARWRVLMIVAEREPIGVSEVADLAVMNVSTITRCVQRMAADGWIASRPRAQDNRVTEVRLTAAGRAQLAEVKAVAAKIFRHATAGLDESDLVRLNQTLRAIAENIDRSPFA